VNYTSIAETPQIIGPGRRTSTLTARHREIHASIADHAKGDGPALPNRFRPRLVAEGRRKISKSTGKVVTRLQVINEWGLDGVPFYVLRELDIGPDGNWTDAGFRSRYQAELGNGLAIS